MGRRPKSRTKTNPFRILAAAQFWDVEWVSRFQAGIDTHVSIRTGPLRAYLSLQSERVWTYLHWLETHGYIRQLTSPKRGEAEFVIRIPSTWNWASPEEGDLDSEPQASKHGAFT